MLHSIPLVAILFCGQLPPPTEVSAATKDAGGVLVHVVSSPYQAGKTEIRVLLPDTFDKSKRYQVVYLLPVESGRENRYGDGLAEARKHDLHNKLQMIFVAATFSHLPWYADHPTDPRIRQETYFLEVVVPFIEKNYPVRPGGGWLIGFSKSGWGAFSLILRHPGRFDKAAAWDAPLMMAMPNRYGMGDIFGTQANFEKYRIEKLLEANAAAFRDKKRLVSLGFGNFRDHHEQCRALMKRLDIAHDHRDGPARKHDWHSGWVEEALKLLASD